MVLTEGEGKRGEGCGVVRGGTPPGFSPTLATRPPPIGAMADRDEIRQNLPNKLQNLPSTA